MIGDIFNKVRRAYSGKAARETVIDLTRFHRIAASPGFDEAATYLLTQLRQIGIEAWTEGFPANHRTSFWTAPSFQEWEATGATLHLVEPADEACRLADYREEKISLIQRSAGFEGEGEVVLGNNLDQQRLAAGQLDLDGKIILTKEDVNYVRRWAVDECGAAGIIFYGMREIPPVRRALDLPDARQYTSFHWRGAADERRCFGFVLSPSQGRKLRALIEQRADEGLSPIRVRAQVDAQLYDGSLKVVTALLAGETAEEIVIVAHLCHPQPSANDNASGSAVALEVVRTLHRLIRDEELPRPHRSIRFLWLPEMIGSYAFLSGHEGSIPAMIAGVNLDMVGGNEGETGSSFLIERSPDAVSSFMPDLLEKVREELLDDASSHTGLGSYPLFRYATTSFAGGSDHYVFSDPTVGVPMPMLIQIPDRFYHTTADTPDHIDPDMLARSGTLAAAGAFFAADAGQARAAWLALEMQARFQVRIVRELQAWISQIYAGSSTSKPHSPAEMKRQLSYRVDRHREALSTLTRLSVDVAPLIERLGAEAVRDVERELERSKRAVADAGEWRSETPDQSISELNAWERRAAKMVPQRNYRGPAAFSHFLSQLPLDRQRAWNDLVDARPAGGRTLPVLAEYWADGERTLLEIVDLVELETGIRDAELIVKRFDLLGEFGLVGDVGR